MSELIISVSGLRGIVGESLTSQVAGRYVAAFERTLGPGPVVVSGDGRANAILALFHDRFGKAHDRECRQSIADVDLDAHLWRIHAVLSTTQYCCHRHSLAPVRSQAEQTTAHRRVEIG